MSDPASNSADVGAKSSNWFSARRFAILSALLLLATFPTVTLGTQTLVARDFGFFAYPLAHYFRECFWRGEWPLWNPFNFCGVPFLAQWTTQTLYPPALFYLLFPLSWSLAFFCLAHLWLGAIGMRRLAYAWTQNGFAAAAAGVVFGFNGLTLNFLTWPSQIAALAWMPWVVLALERAAQHSGRAIILAAFAGALQALAGSPEVMLFTWALGVPLVAARGPRGRLGLAKTGGRVMAVVMLVLGLAAIQLLPFFDLVAHSDRQAYYEASRWAMPGWGWANFLVPLFYSFPLTQGVFFQYDQYWISSYYLPLAALVLALAAFQFRASARTVILGGAAGLGLVLALGDNGPLYEPIAKHVPLLGLMRFPVKFVIPVVFAVPLLAAEGLQRRDLLANHERRRGQRLLVALCAGVAALIAGIVWFAMKYPQYEPPYDQFPATLRCGWQRVLFLWFSAGALLASLPWANWSRGGILRLVFLVALWLDGVTHAPRINPTVDAQVYRTGLSQLSPKPVLGQTRAMMSKEAFLALVHDASPDPLTNYVANRLALNCDLNLLDAIPKVDGFLSVNLKETREVQTLLYSSNSPVRPALMDFLGVAQYTTTNRLYDWTVRTNALPLATIGQKPLFSTNTLSLLMRPDFDFGRYVVLPPEMRPLLKTTNASTASIVASNVSAQRLSFEVRAAQPALLVLSQSYYHPWQAYLDNHDRLPIWRANHAFQAVEVPAGQHRVSFVYRDRGFFLGATISGVTALFTLVALIRFRRGGRG